ncbi:MAG: apolipoprotein N-acyltransferase [bacterium]
MRKRRLELTVWAFLLSLSFYPDYFGFLAWLALVRPLMIITSLSGRPAFNAAYFFSFFFNLFSLYWIAMVTPPGMVTAVTIVAFYYTAVLMACNRLYRIRPLLGLVALPFLWVGMEYFRTLSEFAFPWSDLGYSQSYYLYILQIVSVISVHGLSFLIVIVNVLLWQVFRRTVSPPRRLTAGLLSAAIVIALVAYGWIETPRFPIGGSLDVAMLQGSVPLEEKWAQNNEEHSFHIYDSLIRTVADTSIALYVWPETSAPCYLSHSQTWRSRVSNIVRGSGGYHLVGALGAQYVDGQSHYHNSCYQVDTSGRIGRRYDKVKLVPFSEHVPYQDNLPFLQKKFLRKYLTFIDNYSVQWWSDFYPGDSAFLFHLPQASYGVLICFETTFPEYVRQMIRDGADFLVGITNDTWFGRSVGIHMHSRIFITRAVENRCWSVRVANSGLTYIVDGYGRIRQELPVYDVAALRGKVDRLEKYSVYTRIGDVVGNGSFLITLGIVGILLLSWIGRVTHLSDVISSAWQRR